ncbi:hypothetical protein [Gilvibacter sp.]|uniref:hypothetical protein n=1 Tax=Gilvibacter sp. TaxID=2729997 RepID=UPI003F49BE85
MKPIGGFFELELPKGDSLYHNDAVALSTGRACLNLIIKETQPKKLYLPYYSCEALFQPILECKVDFEFYKINERLELDEDIAVQEGEYLIYINFFGLKRKYVQQLKATYGAQLILDNTHDYFFQEVEGYSFTSARKYFGVPDGAFLYGSSSSDLNHVERFTEASLEHSLHRLLGNQDRSFALFQQYEASLSSDLLRISKVSEMLLKLVDYKQVIQRRQENFEVLERELSAVNTLAWEPDSISTFCYPLLLEKHVEKATFHREKLFIPTLWPDVLERDDIASYPVAEKLTSDLLPLPIDHRYTPDQMRQMAALIRTLL